MATFKPRMDMSDMDMGDTDTSGATGMMKQYFHGTLTDTLWFASWTPTSRGGFAAACIVLFFLAVVDRFLSAVRASAEVRWRARVQAILLPSSSSATTAQSLPSPPRDRQSSSTSSASSDANDDEKPAESSADKRPSSSSAVPTLASSPTSPPPTNTQDPLPAVLDLLPGRRARWAPPFVASIDVTRGVLGAVQLGVHYLLMLAVMTFNIYFFLVILLGAGVGETLFGRFHSSHH